MGLPVAKLVIATNENDILDRFFRSGRYEKQETTVTEPTLGLQSDGAAAHPSGVRETLSPAMDILVSSNFERLLYLLSLPSYPGDISTQRAAAGKQISSWQSSLKSSGNFSVPRNLLEAARESFSSTRVSDPETLATIKTIHSPPSSVPGLDPYILDPHSAVGIAAALRSMAEEDGRPSKTHTIALATAHPAKFAGAVKLALADVKGFNFEKETLPDEFVDLETKDRRVRFVGSKEGLDGMRRILRQEMESEQEQTG